MNFSALLLRIRKNRSKFENSKWLSNASVFSGDVCVTMQITLSRANARLSALLYIAETLVIGRTNLEDVASEFVDALSRPLVDVSPETEGEQDLVVTRPHHLTLLPLHLFEVLLTQNTVGLYILQGSTF